MNAVAQTVPTFIGIGAQKCATTWAHLVLDDHPHVFMAPQKEIDFFSFHYLRGYHWYRRHFAHAAGRVCGEISPSYLWSAEAPDRAQAYAPSLRILVVLRDPVARAFSNHVHEVRKGDYRSADLSFEAGLAQNPTYVEQSLYGKHLGRWLERFPREQVLVLFQEEIAAASLDAARRLYRFVGVEASHPSALVANRSHENIGHRSEAVKHGLRALGRIARRAGLERLVEAGKQAPLLGDIYVRNRRDFRREIPPMAKATGERLIERFAADLDRLSSLLDRRDLPWPTWRAAQACKDPSHTGSDTYRQV